MITPSWKWAAAKATGTSHLRAGRGCDDFGGCMIVNCADAEALIIAVSDGAGSATHSVIGSRLAIMRFVRCASVFLKSGGSVDSLSKLTVLEWFDDIRDRIFRAAERLGCGPRELAATLVACLVTPTRAAFIHVGDGAAVFRLANTDNWQIGSWPSQGEYWCRRPKAHDD
jgi:serine/threonine protein phosphatase PrpC